jgi:hypothetical protein
MPAQAEAVAQATAAGSHDEEVAGWSRMTAVEPVAAVDEGAIPRQEEPYPWVVEAEFMRVREELAGQALQALPVDEILAFHRIFGEVRAAAYQVDLWDAASLINNGSSDDGFEDFRGWLIGRGRSVYEAALRDADWLASLPQVTGRRHPHRPRLECQDLLSAWVLAYEAVTGEEPSPWPPASPVRQVLLGEDWDFGNDRELARRLPRLWSWHQQVAAT